MRAGGWWALVVLGPLALVFGWPVVSHRERALLDDAVNQERMMMYELLPTQSLSVPVAANVEAVRVVAHGFSASGSRLGEGSAVLKVELSTGPGTVEYVSLPLKIKDPVATTEDGDLRAGDRTTLNVDTSRGVAGVLTITLDQLHGCDGLLVRFYRRQVLDQAAALARQSKLGWRERRRLAQRAGALDWADLEPDGRSALLALRWTKVAALPDPQRALVSRVLTLQQPNAKPAAPDPEPKSPAEGEDPLPPNAPSESVGFVRITPERPIVVEAHGSPLVLRLSTRLPLPSDSQSARLTLLAKVDGPTSSIQHRLEQIVHASSTDRYRVGGAISSGSNVRPSERALFHLLLPSFSRLTLSPQSGVVDVSLSELDPNAAPRPAPSSDTATTPIAWSGFIPRRSSNFEAFSGNARGNWWLGRPAPPSTALAGLPPYGTNQTFKHLRVQRPVSAATLVHAERRYVAATSLRVHVPQDGALLPLRLFSKSGVDVEVLIDQGLPRRRASGAPRYVTAARSLHLDGDAKLGIVLGDDLEAGTHVVSLSYDPSVKVWLNVPWEGSTHLPQESAWLSGDLEP